MKANLNKVIFQDLASFQPRTKHVARQWPGERILFEAVGKFLSNNDIRNGCSRLQMLFFRWSGPLNSSTEVMSSCPQLIS